MMYTLLLALRIFGAGLLFLSILAGLAAAWQEGKCFRDTKFSPLAYLKVFLFMELWMLGCGLCCIPLFPLHLIGVNVGTFVIDYVEYYLATFLCKVFLGNVSVAGTSNVPGRRGEGGAVVYCMNHQSMVDIIVMYFLNQRAVWIAKKSVSFLPGVGQVMVLGRHILLDRNGRSSIKEMYKLAKDKLFHNTSIYIFPQGTRSRVKTLPFKHGGFSIALETGADVIPVSVFIDKDAWSGWFPLLSSKPIAKLTVHPRLSNKMYSNNDEGKKSMATDCFDRIYSVLEVKPDFDGCKFQERKK